MPTPILILTIFGITLATPISELAQLQRTPIQTPTRRLNITDRILNTTKAKMMFLMIGPIRINPTRKKLDVIDAMN